MMINRYNNDKWKKVINWKISASWKLQICLIEKFRNELICYWVVFTQYNQFNKSNDIVSWLLCL